MKPFTCFAPHKSHIKRGDIKGGICFEIKEAVKVLTGLGEPLYSKLLFLDTRGMEFKKFNLHRRNDCEICGEYNPC